MTMITNHWEINKSKELGKETKDWEIKVTEERVNRVKINKINLCGEQVLKIQ